MTGLIIALLGSFTVVLAGAIVMVLVHRRNLREWRRQKRLAAALQRSTPARPQVPMALPGRWVAVRSMNTEHLREALAIRGPMFPWSEALSRVDENRLFLSAPVDGWTLIVGAAVPDPATDVDAVFRFLLELSREAGDVQYFSLDRVLGFHGWARLKDGRVLRGYAWAGETVWNQGRLTLDERLLGMRCRAYGEETPALGYGAVSPEMENTERVPLLAQRWGIDLAAATESLLRDEAVNEG